MTAKTSVLLLVLCVGAVPGLAAQPGVPAQKTSQAKQSPAKQNATTAIVPPVVGGGDVRHGDLAVTKETGKASPKMGPATGGGKAEKTSDQTIKTGASRAEGASDQTTKLGTPRGESAGGPTSTVVASRRNVKTAAITAPGNAIQAGPDTKKKKKPAAPPHRH